MTQLPIVPIRPKRSAIGMKTLGSSMPRVGCFQRSSASTAVTLPLRGVDLRLVEELELACDDAPCAGRAAARTAPRRRRPSPSSRSSGSSRRSASTAYIAASARAISLAWLQPSGYMRDADRARDHHLAAVDRVRLATAPSISRVGHLATPSCEPTLREQQQELVAADPGDDVLAARQRLQPLADLLEHEVADANGRRCR